MDRKMINNDVQVDGESAKHEPRITIEIYYEENEHGYAGFDYKADDELNERDILFLMACAATAIINMEE